MTQYDELVATLKAKYKRDVRKQIVKAMLEAEANDSVQNNAHEIMGKIFSYVLHQLDWNFVANSKEWDDTPLQLIQAVFPNIEKTKWFQEQKLTVSKAIPVHNGTVTE